MERQKLHDHVDSAAHAGAFELPASGTSAKTWAVTMAKTQDPDDDARHRALLRRGLHRRRQAGGVRADPGDVRPRDVLHRPGAVQHEDLLDPVPEPPPGATRSGSATPRTSTSTSPRSSAGRRDRPDRWRPRPAGVRAGRPCPTRWTSCSWPTGPPAWPTSDREDMQTAIVDEPRRDGPDAALRRVRRHAQEQGDDRPVPRRPPPRPTAPRAASGSPSTSPTTTGPTGTPRSARPAGWCSGVKCLPSGRRSRACRPGATARTSPRPSRARRATCSAATPTTCRRCRSAPARRRRC